MPNTALDYFSRVKEFLKIQYPEEELWKMDEKVWYSPCRQALETVVERNVLQIGGVLHDTTSFSLLSTSNCIIAHSGLYIYILPVLEWNGRDDKVN